jgi:anti-sigma factor RsiW
MPPTKTDIETLLQARRDGFTLREAAEEVGVHVATVCRWQHLDPELRQALAEAATEGRPPPEPRPWVRWRKDCPLCRARVVVRTARGGCRFWRCGRWPLCSWASWRPRASRNCKRCGGPRYWSHSRKSIACGGCGVRTPAP